MAAPIDFSAKRIFKVKVFSPVAGIRLLLKFEGAGAFFQKLSAPITEANVWEELTFDFSAEAVNNLNDQIVFMFDFGTAGNGGPLSTYLFDDVTLSACPALDLRIDLGGLPVCRFWGSSDEGAAKSIPDRHQQECNGGAVDKEPR
jgi:hypothetical protein